MQARYQVRHELGRGGMAVVLAAYDAVLERDVALKVMLPLLVSSREAVERFVNEARSLAKLETPHVVRVLDCGTLRTPASCATRCRRAPDCRLPTPRASFTVI